MTNIRLFSFGGGVQSTAVMMLQAMGRLALPYEVFIFANVGHDSENPATIEYVENYTKPFAAAHGLCFVEVQKRLRDGQPETLMNALERQRRSVLIPARMSNGAPGNRKCTDEFKVRQIDHWVKRGGYEQATIGLGISLDEFRRMRSTEPHDCYGKRKLGFWRQLEYPLIDARLTRMDCLKIVHEAGLPVPPKSSCFFCPFHRPNEWVEMKRESPDLFERACRVEALINAVRGDLQKDYVYLHSRLVPLRAAVANQPRLFEDDDDNCDSGYCMT